MHQTQIQYRNSIPVLVMISDGLPNVAIHPRGDPYEEIRLLCRQLRRERIFTIVVDTEPGGRDAKRSNCREMAALTDGSYLKLTELSQGAIEAAVASQLSAVPPRGEISTRPNFATLSPSLTPPLKGNMPMTINPDNGQTCAGGGAIDKAISDDRTSACALLCTLLDAKILFQDEGVRLGDLTTLWSLYCSDCAPDREAEQLGLLPSHEEDVCALPGAEEVSDRLGSQLAAHTVRLPTGELTLDILLYGFAVHCGRELGIQIDDRTPSWGGRCFSSLGRCHHALIRPRPVLLRAHPDAFILLLCRLPTTDIKPIIDLLVEAPGLRQRLAFVDLDTGSKINLTKSDVFVHFERYLRRKHGLRLVVHPGLTQGLVDAGVMKLEMG